MKPNTLTVNQKHQIYFTNLLLKRKKKSDLLYYVEKESKKPKDKQICNDLSASVEAYFLLLLRLACLLQLRLTFCYSCVLHCTYSRERERERERELKKEMKRKKQKVKWVLLLSHCCTCTKTCGCNFKMCGWWESSICRINNVWREKNIKWAMILLLMVHLLFVI